MQLIAVIVGVALAAVGWIVTQAQARRAVRRTMRIDYLLGAYRRLERACNRPMTTDNERDLEAAVADIQLLGSVSQVCLATNFVRCFATTSRADADQLLEDLRASLRRELLLQAVPSCRVVLRIERAVDTGSETPHVWERAGVSTDLELRQWSEAMTQARSRKVSFLSSPPENLPADVPKLPSPPLVPPYIPFFKMGNGEETKDA